MGRAGAGSCVSPGASIRIATTQTYRPLRLTRADVITHPEMLAVARDWTRHEVSAQIPPDATSIIFGVFLAGRGQVELRNPELEPHPANQQQQPGKTQEH